MITIRFRSSGFDKSITVALGPHERPTLLSVATEHGVPILFNCKSGDCGACQVRVHAARDHRRMRAPMGDAERYRLQAMDLLAGIGKENVGAASAAGEQTRLACQYTLDKDDDGQVLVVTFASGLGST